MRKRLHEHARVPPLPTWGPAARRCAARPGAAVWRWSPGGRRVPPCVVCGAAAQMGARRPPGGPPGESKETPTWPRRPP